MRNETTEDRLIERTDLLKRQMESIAGMFRLNPVVDECAALMMEIESRRVRKQLIAQAAAANLTMAELFSMAVTGESYLRRLFSQEHSELNVGALLTVCRPLSLQIGFDVFDLGGNLVVSRQAGTFKHLDHVSRDISTALVTTLVAGHDQVRITYTDDPVKAQIGPLWTRSLFTAVAARLCRLEIHLRPKPRLHLLVKTA